MELPVLVKTCELFVYLNPHFRSYQFEEVPSSQTFIRSDPGKVWVDAIWSSGKHSNVL